MRRFAPWFPVIMAAVLGGALVLVFDRSLAALLATQPVSPQVTATLPTREPPVVVVLPTSNSLAAPTPPVGEVAAQIASLQNTLAQQSGLLLVIRAERHAALAAEAISVNDVAVADRELVAAHSALDSAFVLLSEDLKQVIDGQRRELGRMRSELRIHPEGLDTRLRATQDLLLNVVGPAPP